MVVDGKTLVAMLRILPNSWASVLITGFFLMLMFMACGWYVERVMSALADSSIVAAGHPVLRDLKPYLVFLVICMILIMFVVGLFRWVSRGSVSIG